MSALVIGALVYHFVGKIPAGWVFTVLGILGMVGLPVGLLVIYQVMGEPFLTGGMLTGCALDLLFNFGALDIGQGLLREGEIERRMGC